ncbi:MAG: aminotransferase class V-fold PLP-dependent enzyme [Chitinophagales bacterium]|nr:aminotransferase class V-fold PLP-dependent enzyme [Chitinophagales bacterium]MDW8393225.1 aminotransferase class V-fold PLP-dependent enzyme [Chitinophagales bacterium]
MLPPASPYSRYWLLDADVVFLNHGSFGACPLPILQRQEEHRRAMEQEPVRYLVRRLEPLLWQTKEQLASFIGTHAADLVFVPNATYALNTVLHSLSFHPGDELLTTTHVYGACLHALQVAAQRTGARLVIADVPFPVSSPDQVMEAISQAISPRTRFAVLDHITSPTGLIFPVQQMVALLQDAGVDCFVDGAHVPGHLPLDLRSIGAAYYAGNTHKWLCTPKGSAFLYVRPDRQAAIRPLVTSHRYDAPVPEPQRWSSAFFWPGTTDFSPWLCIADALNWLPTLMGNLTDLMKHNRDLCCAAAQHLQNRLQLALPAPTELLGCMTAFPLGPAERPPYAFGYIHPLQEALWEAYRIEVPVMVWGHPPQLILRISAYCYNSMAQYEYLAEALRKLLPRYVPLRRM